MSDLILTASRMDTKSRCDMRDFYSYFKGYRPAKMTTSLAVGSMTHKGLEGFYRDMDLNEIYKFMTEERSEDPVFWDSEQGEMSEALARLYVQGYYQKWKEDFVDAQTVGSMQNIQPEKEFCLDIMGHKFAGKLDLLYMDEYGMPCIREFKTAGMSALKPGSNYLKILPMSIQTTIYTAAVQRMYSPEDPNDIIPNVVYDIIGKTGKKPAQKRPYLKRSDYETKELLDEAKLSNVESVYEYIERISSDYMVDDAYHREHINVTREEQHQRMFEIIRMEKQRPSNNEYELRVRNTNSCTDFGGCPFIEVCLGRESLDSESFARKKQMHPELTEIKEPEWTLPWK